MFINLRKVLLGAVLSLLVASSAQAGSPQFSGFSNFVRQHSSQGASSAMQTVKNKVAQTQNQQVRPSLSTMDVIKVQNLASDVKERLLNHQFTPSTMDVIKAQNLASDLKSRVLSHDFSPSTMDVIKAQNFLSDVKSRLLDRD